jgi:hypothetical protein
MRFFVLVTVAMAWSAPAFAQFQFEKAAAGDPVIVAFSVINSKFEDEDCPSVKGANRLSDGSILAVCSNGERFRVGADIAMKCSAVEKLGIAGC